ncbi:MAG: hypothetical protein H6686_11395 [Fibrobacteria bacterium]|nr:hypothetical protein [Fibrobacteria bacterium]
MLFPARVLSLALLIVAAGWASPRPMEPASRTLFVFVHGINPKCSGALENDFDSDLDPALSCEGKDDKKNGPYCVDRNEILGRAGQVWVKDLDGMPSDDALFCFLDGSLFEDGQYSLRSFSDPGRSPVMLRNELGKRDWEEATRLRKVDGGVFQNREGDPVLDLEPGEPVMLRSHVVESMVRFATTRRDRAEAKDPERRTEFERTLLELHPAGEEIEDLHSLFAAAPDSMPSRVVVFAHSMGA